jgi:hypothetical protein
MSTFLLTIAIVSALWGVMDVILISIELDKRGIRVNMFLFRVNFFRYLRQYKKITLKENGKVGSLYYSFIFAMNLALVCAIIGLLLRFR